jgi:hypothetical protein
LNLAFELQQARDVIGLAIIQCIRNGQNTLMHSGNALYSTRVLHSGDFIGQF